MTTYIAFLRGINVGGKNLLKMEALRRAFQSLGFQNVRTFIQCGNVFFDTAEMDVEQLSRDIATKLRDSLGYEAVVILRTAKELRSLIRNSPFRENHGRDAGDNLQNQGRDAGDNPQSHGRDAGDNPQNHGRDARATDVMLCVAFLADTPKQRTRTPLVSATENLEVVAIKSRAAFIVCRRKKTGWFAFPNNFIEKQLGVTATTRQWKTVNRIAESIGAIGKGLE
ncbi:MAG TPA: DUF1697 domain-containing protein [Pyrinomonadaceae bacterium]|nr:DUF1697 domain-containing protein [Pyrinomonadaceae bacterium]